MVYIIIRIIYMASQKKIEYSSVYWRNLTNGNFHLCYAFPIWTIFCTLCKIYSNLLIVYQSPQKIVNTFFLLNLIAKRDFSAVLCAYQRKQCLAYYVLCIEIFTSYAGLQKVILLFLWLLVVTVEIGFSNLFCVFWIF